MTGAPLPPHERTWRHPSEVGRAVHEPATARSATIMVSTAAVGLLLVALLAVAVTPGGDPGQVTTVIAAPRTRRVVVPIDAGVALMTQPGGEPVAVGERVVAELATGGRVTALVTATDGSGLVVVSVPVDQGRSFEMAPPRPRGPGPDDTVQVHGPDVAVVRMDALAGLEVADGTPITDADGQLLGLCVEDPASGVTTMMVIDRARVDAIGGSD